MFEGLSIASCPQKELPPHAIEVANRDEDLKSGRLGVELRKLPRYGGTSDSRTSPPSINSGQNSRVFAAPPRAPRGGLAEKNKCGTSGAYKTSLRLQEFIFQQSLPNLQQSQFSDQRTGGHLYSPPVVDQSQKLPELLGR